MESLHLLSEKLLTKYNFLKHLKKTPCRQHNQMVFLYD